MKKLSSEIIQTKSCYFSEADSFTILDRKIPLNEIINTLKTASLLYDHILFSAAYFWASKEIASLIPYIQNMLAAGIVLPVIRSPNITRDITDYFDIRICETQKFNANRVRKSLSFTIENPKNRVIAHELDSIGSLLYINDGSVSNVFKNLLINDIVSSSKEPHSINNIVYLKVSPEKHEKILLSISDYIQDIYLSRASVARKIFKLPITEQLQHTLLRRVSDLYMVSNAIVCNCELLSTSNSFVYFPLYRRTQIGTLSASNIDLFLKVINLCGIPTSIIHSLTPEEIINIRKTPEFISFLKYYYKIVNSVELEEKKYVQKIWGKFSLKIRSEKIKKQVVSYLLHVSSISALIFIAALKVTIQEQSTIGYTLMVGGGSLGATSYIIKKLEWFQDKPIVDFISYMTKKEYKKNINNISEQI